MPRILLTGAGGGIGTRLRQLLPAIYPDLRLSDIRSPTDLKPTEKFIDADLADLAQTEAICKDIDGIIHLGGYSVEGPWDPILQSNIIGCYNLFEAARRQGVKRVVFASSNHAVGFYPRTHHVGNDVQPRPDGRYGVSKVFGEALGSLYSDKHGMRVTCLRIGNFGDVPLDKRRLSIWLHPEDMVQLCRIGLEHPDIRFEVLYGASLNERPGGTTAGPMPSDIAPGIGPRTTPATRWPSRPSYRQTRSGISIRAGHSARWSSLATRAASGAEQGLDSSTGTARWRSNS